MSSYNHLIAIIEELAANAQEIDREQLDNVERLIEKADRIFIAGAGRSGFAARAFANRLMHLGYHSYFVGEPTTPSIQREDLLIIGSGSGETASLVTMAKKAKEVGAAVATLTIFPANTVGSLADAYITLPGVTSKVDEGEFGSTSLQPKGSSFEQLSWLVYDSMIVTLKNKKNQSDEDMFFRHANLE
ncbi:6-phospho-3-hexuloisomerase [Oceanobacillus sp. CFH 90083]|uniref:6-phospho-3-hexuloisomerase n=1 Tax=Oceanobacillus sp. CFH 90083 TaxID=2592336 RepID=UPI00128C2520|nr:6-phospho-3-hexuloisomerase [Oceanobacillus sp. CFH 90083]